MIFKLRFWVLAGWLAATPSLAAAQCVGDCDGGGSVTINEVVTAVNIGLALLGGDACRAADANGDGSVAINEVITAVNNGLTGCPATPIPTATGVPTASPTPAVDVSGTWRLDQPSIVSSTCPSELEEIAAEEFLEGISECRYLIEQDGSAVQVTENCEGEVDSFFGQVDGSGRINVVDVDDGRIDGCSFTATSTFTADASTSPTTGTNSYDFSFAPSCGLDDCVFVVELRLRRI